MVKSETKKKETGIMFNCVLGAIVGMAATLLLLYAFSILVAEGKLPRETGESLIIVSCFIGVLFGSQIAIKRRGRGALPCAFLCFVIWILLVMSFAIFGEGDVFNLMKMKVAIGALAGSLLGSAIHVNSTGRRKKGKKK